MVKHPATRVFPITNASHILSFGLRLLSKKKKKKPICQLVKHTAPSTYNDHRKKGAIKNQRLFKNRNDIWRRPSDTENVFSHSINIISTYVSEGERKERAYRTTHRRPRAHSSNGLWNTKENCRSDLTSRFDN